MRHKRRYLYLAAIAALGIGAYFLFGNVETFSKENKVLGPEGVVEEFTSAMKKGEFDKAVEFCNADSMNVYMEAYKQMWNKLSKKDGETFAETAKILAGTQLNFTGMQELDGVCTVDHTLELNGVQKNHQATLRMEEGEWKMIKITDRR